MTPLPALFVGDVGMDLTLVVPKTPAADEKVFATEALEDVGGVVANASVACIRAGTNSRLVVRTGDDLMAQTALDLLRRRGVSVSVETVPGRTCQALITVDPDGEKRLIVVPGVSMYPSVSLIETIDLSGVDWVHTAAYSRDGAAALAERCRERGIPWSVDLEPATIPRDVSRCHAWLAGADTVFVNSRAAERLGRDPVAALRNMGVHRVILTRGASGVEYFENSHRHLHVPSPNSIGPAVDTTGAGDALAGWYVGRTVAGDDPLDAIAEAVWAASLSCLEVGAQIAYPSRTTVIRRAKSATSLPISNPVGKAPL